MYVTGGERCFQLTNASSSPIEPLFSKQEEADTRMFLHAKNAAQESTSVIIASEDTDVFILALALHSELDITLLYAG